MTSTTPDQPPSPPVTLTRAVYLGATEVTRKEWKTVMNTAPWVPKTSTAPDGDEYPANWLTFDEAQAFCRELSRREGATYRLPTEAEWEFACRAGTTTTYSFGDDASRLVQHAWCSLNTHAIGRGYVHEVGGKPPNPFGLHDMHGNAWEWCEDVRVPTLPGGVDPLVMTGGEERVHRGGGCSFPQHCTSGHRASRASSTGARDVGFRVVLVVSARQPVDGRSPAGSPFDPTAESQQANNDAGDSSPAKPSQSSEAEFATRLEEIQRAFPQAKDGPILSEFKSRFDRAQTEVESYKKGHIIFGRLQLEKGADPRSVISQMVILEHGYFVDAIGASDRPVGFRLHGYEPLDVVPRGPGPFEDVGTLKMNRLPASRLASAKGRLKIESRQGAPRPDQVNVTWRITADPINTPHNGTEGSGGFGLPPLRSKVSPDGSFSIAGMSPAKYYLSIEAPKCSKHWQYVEFAEGEAKELEPIPVEVARKVSFEYVVSPDGNFRNAAVAKASLSANDRWRASGDIPGYGSDLEIGQKDGRLLMRYVYAPCHIADLGPAKLAERLDVGPQDGTRNQPTNVPIENGHVYLVHQAAWKRWILLRAETEE